jgi:NAD+ kinase
MDPPKILQTVALIGKYQGIHLKSLQKTILDIIDFLERLDKKLYIETDTAKALGNKNRPTIDIAQMGGICDVAIVVGGDGTMLSASRQLGPQKVPLIGINQGRLGFITDIPLSAYQETLFTMLDGAYTYDTRSLIQAQVVRSSSTIYNALAVNDVVVSRGNTASMIELCLEIDGHFVANQRGDGMIVATPTGSTAYALSAGGPVLYPSVPGWVLTPVSPHTFSNRPIVLSDPSEVVIEVVSGNASTVNFDMVYFGHLEMGDRIVITKSEHKVCFLHPKHWNFFDILRAKLHWNANVYQA